MIALGDTESDFKADMLMTPWLNDAGQSLEYIGPARRHNGGAQMLFCDSHVEWSKKTNWVKKTNKARRRWNYDHQPHPECWGD